jgi:hypothetical protein
MFSRKSHVKTIEVMVEIDLGQATQLYTFSVKAQAKPITTQGKILA